VNSALIMTFSPAPCYFSRSKIPQHTFLRYSHFSSRPNYTHHSI